MSLTAYIISGLGFLFAVMVTTALAGHTVSMGKKHAGKTLLKDEFATFRALSIAFLFEAIALSVLFVILEPIIEGLIWFFILWLPTIVSEAFVLYYSWFIAEFHYKFRNHWRYIILPQLVPVINLLLVWYAPWALKITI